MSAIVLWFVAVSFLPRSRAVPSGDAVVLREFICDSMPTPQCHASTIAESHGRLVAAWFGGEYEHHPGVGIWVSQRTEGGWTKPVEVANGVQSDGARFSCWNPVLFQPRQGPLMLFYKAGASPSAWWGMLMTSDDGGEHWSSPRRLPGGVIGPVKNKPVECGDGLLVCPSSTEDHGWEVWCEMTGDGGVTWRVTGPLNDTAAIQAIQPTFVRGKDGEIIALGRTKQQKMFFMRSSDCGSSWSPMRLVDVPNPNSGIDAAGLCDGRILLVYNHATGSAEHWDAGRDVIDVAMSSDGIHWSKELELEREAGKEFSYPAVIQTSDGLVHITYTWKRTKIRHVILNPSSIGSIPLVKRKT